MAAPISKHLQTSPIRRPGKPVYARTNVLYNDQIAWKAGRDADVAYGETDLQRPDLRSITDATDDLNALNGLQIHRAKPLTPLEVKQPLRHVQSALPKDVRTRIYTGGLYGSAEGVFSCSDSKFDIKVKEVFENGVYPNGEMHYNDFFRRLRRSEWLLWDVETKKGHWAAVIAHLYKKPVRNPNETSIWDDSDASVTGSSDGFNRIDNWCVVTATPSPEGDAIVDRVRRRLPDILKEGRVKFDKGSEVFPSIWVPTDRRDWSSGIHVYAIIQALMRRLTEFYCKDVSYQQSFWDPLPGWLNVDEVRAEMQGRAAQRCLAATGYRSRIAIESIRRRFGVNEVVRANELKPKYRDNQAYLTGEVGKDGRCIPVGQSVPAAMDSYEVWAGDGDDKDWMTPDTYDNLSGLPPTRISWQDNKFTDDGSLFEPAALAEIKEQPDSAKVVSGGTAASEPLYKIREGIFGGPVGPPPAHVYGWEEESTDDSGLYRHVPLTKLAQLSRLKIDSPGTREGPEEGKFGGPVGSPPSHVFGWDDESTDDSGPFRHVPLTKLKKLAELKATSETQTRADGDSESSDGIGVTDKPKPTKGNVRKVQANRALKDVGKKTRERGQKGLKRKAEGGVPEAEAQEMSGIEIATTKRPKAIEMKT